MFRGNRNKGRKKEGFRRICILLSEVVVRKIGLKSTQALKF